MVKIQYKDLIIHTISRSSGVFSGDNVLHQFRSNQKTNEGHGSIHGDLIKMIQSNSIVIDSDVLDMTRGMQADNKKEK